MAQPPLRKFTSDFIRCDIDIEKKASIEEISAICDEFYRNIACLFVPNSEKELIEKQAQEYWECLKSIDCNNLELKRESDEKKLDPFFNYLDSIRLLFRSIFSVDKPSDYAPMRSVIKNITHKDIALGNDGKIEIGIRNPIVLESLLLCNLQFKHLLKLKESLKSDILYSLYVELFQAKAERLFKDIIVLFEENFYRIIDVEYNVDNKLSKISNLKFIAEKENDLSSIEVISATRLFEKIVGGLDKTRHYRVLLIGEVMVGEDGINSSIFDLNQMIEKCGYNVEVDNITKKDSGFAQTLSVKELEKIKVEYDKVFVLDCPEIYYPITLEEKSDASTILYRSEKGISELLQKDTITGQTDFFNKNSFAAIYYRVQNLLLDFTRRNLKKGRGINTNILEWFRRAYESNNEAKTGEFEKQAYIYISNNKNFKDEMYDRFNFVRLERYNSKDCRIVKYPEPPLPPYKKIISDERKITITLYKLLKMLSPDVEFYNKILGLKDKKFVDIFDLTQKINVEIRCSQVIDNELKLNIYTNCPYGTPEPVEEATRILVAEMFDFATKKQSNQILLYCYKKAVANVFSGCVDNFNDCLFHHFYMKKLLHVYKNDDEAKVGFTIKDYRLNWYDPAEKPYEVKPKAFQYSVKRVAYEMMKKLDASYCDNRDIIEQRTNVKLNNENILIYVAGLTNACEVFGYTDSRLYSRLCERI